MGTDPLSRAEVNARLDAIERELLSLVRMVRNIRVDLALDSADYSVIE